MNQDDNLILEYQTQIEKKYPSSQYPVESSEGDNLQDIGSNLMKIPDECLSQEMRQRKDSLLEIIYSEKIRGFI